MGYDGCRAYPHATIEAPPAHSVLVGVLDAGIDYNAPSIRCHIHTFSTPSTTGRTYGVGRDLLGGLNDYFPNFQIFKNESIELSDRIMVREHGTHVAQLTILNDSAIGIIPVRILPVAKQEGDDELQTNDKPRYMSNLAERMLNSMVDGAAFAVEHGAQVINMSLGFNVEELPLENQIHFMAQVEARMTQALRTTWRETLFVVASGNEFTEIDRQTQAVPMTLDVDSIIGVGALLDSHHTIGNYSNFGRYVDVYIRGSDLYSAVPGGWAPLSGTSMAAPIVAHLAAQLKVIDPTLTPAQLRGLIMNTADSVSLPVQNSDPSLPSDHNRLVRVVNIYKARRKARELLAHPETRSQWLTAPFAHGQAPRG